MSNKDQVVQLDKLKLYVDQKMEELQKQCCMKDMFLEEMNFVQKAQDRFKAILTTCQSENTNNTLRLNVLDTSVQRRADLAEFKSLSVIVMQQPSAADFKAQEKKINDQLNYFSDLASATRNDCAKFYDMVSRFDQVLCDKASKFAVEEIKHQIQLH